MSASPRLPARTGPTGPAGPAAVPDPRRHARSGRAALALLLLAGVAACARTGDLGRPERSAWTSLGLAAGTLAAGARGEPVSRFRLTDDEAELRERAWRFLVPALDRSGFETAFASLVQARVLPRSARIPDPAGYTLSLLSEPAASPASRYQRIAGDAAADRALVVPFVTLANRVDAADRARLRSLSFVRSLETREVGDAVARVAENRCLVAWVRHEAGQRAGAYRHALERLLIEAPQNEAVAAERALTALEAQLAALDALDGAPAVDEPGCAAPATAQARSNVRIIVK